MNKFNKKGFTLIEMLVVIAIIAVLVSIVIPVVGNSTEKAKAAADAANLRSVQAELNIAYMTGTPDATTKKITTTNAVIDCTNATAPTATATPECPVSATDGTTTMSFDYDENTGWVATYGSNGISYFAGKAK